MARKLLNESAVYPPIFCDPLCDTTKIPYGICPSMCGVLCPPFCIPKPPLFEFPPLPLPPPPPPPPAPIAVSHKSHRLSLALTISLAILAAAFFLFTCYTIYKFCSSWFLLRRRPRPSQRPEEDEGHDDFLDEEHGPIVDHPIWYIRTIGLQPSAISAITIVRYKRGEGLIEGTDCAVCLSEFQEDESLRLLPKCNHAFHIPCIDTWLRSHTNCPMCRAGVVNNAAAPLPSQEPAVQNSGLVEQNQLEISVSNREFTMDLESEFSELRRAIDDDGISRSQSGLKTNEDGNGLDGVLPMRRSVSFESVSASTIHSAIAYAFSGSYCNSDNHLVEVKDSIIEDDAQRIEFNGGLSRLVESQRPMQTAGTSSIKRSVSCSAKVFLSRHSSRNRNSH